MIQVKLSDIKQGHLVDRPEALKKLNLRKQALENARSEILGKGVVTAEFLDAKLSSRGGIQVLPYRDKFFVIDGNGRLVALAETFKNNPDLLIEVTFIDVKNTKKFDKWIDQLREIRDLPETTSRGNAL